MSGPAGTPPRLLVLLGPTGTGKSSTAVEVAAAIGGEIVGCDSLQVYRGLDAATAKPTAADRARVPHHLVDCVDPGVDFSIADYVETADATIQAIAGRGAVPVIVGGTGMYLRGVLRGLIPAPRRDTRLRARLESILQRGGEKRLRRLLRRADPGSERRVASGDHRRLARAIEIARAGGATWSERIERDGQWRGGAERYPSLKIGLDMDRGKLAATLEARVDRFFEAGLVDEVRALLRDGVPPSANALKAIGYREVVAAIGSGEDPEAVRGAVRRKTRLYSKKQRTWFRSEPDVVWLDAEQRGLNVEYVVRSWRSWQSRRSGPGE